MAKSRDTIAAPPPTPTPVPGLVPPNGVEGGTPVDVGSVPEPTPPPVVDDVTGNVPVPPDMSRAEPDVVIPHIEGEGRDQVGGGVQLKDGVPDTSEPASIVSDGGEPAQPEIGGEPLEQTAQEERVAPNEALNEHMFGSSEQNDAVAEQAFETLKAEPFDPATNLGDWDGDGTPGGAAPAVEEKSYGEMSNVELGADIGVAHAQNAHDMDVQPSTQERHDTIRKTLKETADGKLPNGGTLDNEFWTAYDQSYEREMVQLDADALSEDDRLRRIEQTLGLLSPRS